ncbi:MAG: HK97 family phage prohead protease [Bacteroidales bacterium]
MDQAKRTFGQVREFDRAKAEESRTIPFTFSTGARDRHGTRLNMDGWSLENFNRNGIAGYMHNVYGGGMCDGPNPDDVIGPARAWVEEGELRGEITFEEKDLNPLADKIFRKILHGTLKAVSVGFIDNGEGRWGEGREAVDGDEPTWYFAGQELLEISVVNIPSNPEALRRSFSQQTSRALGYVFEMMGRNYSLGEIENMTVRQILNRIETPKQADETDKRCQFCDEPIIGKRADTIYCSDNCRLGAHRKKAKDKLMQRRRRVKYLALKNR